MVMTTETMIGIVTETNWPLVLIDIFFVKSRVYETKPETKFSTAGQLAIPH